MAGPLTGSGVKLSVAHKDSSTLRTALCWVTALKKRAILPPASLKASSADRWQLELPSTRQLVETEIMTPPSGEMQLNLMDIALLDG